MSPILSQAYDSVWVGQFSYSSRVVGCHLHILVEESIGIMVVLPLGLDNFFSISGVKSFHPVMSLCNILALELNNLLNHSVSLKRFPKRI